MKNQFENIGNILNESREFQSKEAEARQHATKWERTGLLEGIDDEVERYMMAQLLENQARELIRESTHTSTTAGNEEWSGVALPLVRKVFGEIGAKNMLSLQTMNMPSGLVFWVDFYYDTSKTGYTSASGTGYDKVFGLTEGTDAPQGGLYGAGRYGYSMNAHTSLAATATTGSIHWSDVNFNHQMSASVSAGSNTLKTLKLTTSSAWALDPEAVRSFQVTSSTAGAIAGVYQTYTKISGSYLIFVVSGSTSGSAADQVSLLYSKAPTETNRNDFEDKTGADIGIPEIRMQFRQEGIIAKERKLKTTWTPEAAQDIKAYHAVDIENEITGMLSKHVEMEVDKELIDMLYNNTDTTEYWSARPGYEYNTTSRKFENQTNYYISNKSDWFKSLFIKIQKVSNQILQKTLRGDANFIVVSPAMSTIIEAIPGYTPITDGTKMQYQAGVQQIGTLSSNRWTVYKNPYMTERENQILVGYKGPSFLECGAVYAPYIPLILSPIVYDYTNFTPHLAVMTRYAKKMIRREFYGKVIVHGMNYI